jgi:hypothetical protein
VDPAANGQKIMEEVKALGALNGQMEQLVRPPPATRHPLFSLVLFFPLLVVRSGDGGVRLSLVHPLFHTKFEWH